MSIPPLPGGARAWIVLPVAIAAGIGLMYLTGSSKRSHFEPCRLSLGRRIANGKTVSDLVSEFHRIPEFRNARFNVGGVYDAQAVNLLIPDSAARDSWSPDACEIPAAPPTCRAYRTDHTIVCNPALARQILSQRIQPGPWKPGAYLAARYLVLSILGHELAHLIDTVGDGKPHDAAPPLDGRKLACFSRNDTGLTAEERADAWGIAAACEIIRADPMLAAMPRRTGEVLEVLHQARADLDEAYYSMDDACMGDRDYPSMSRRKHGFAQQFLSCVYVDSTNPVADFARLEREAFDATEARLRARQIAGHAASGFYGRESLDDHAVIDAGVSNAVLTLDATGHNTTLWLARAGSWDRLAFDSLIGWPNVGHLLHASMSGSRIDMLVRHADTLSVIAIECSGAAMQARCRAQSVMSRATPRDALADVGPDGSMLLRDSARLSRYDDYRAFLRGMPASEFPDPASTDETATRAGTAILFETSDKGMYLGTVYTITASRFMLDLGQNETGCLQSPRIIDDRFVFLLRRGSELTGNCNAGFLPSFDGTVPVLQLWDCPVTVFATTPSVMCDVFDAPRDASSFVSSGTLDLAASVDARIASARGLEHGLVVANYGSLWIVDRSRNLTDVVPGHGVVSVNADRTAALTYRARIVEQVRLNFKPVRVAQRRMTNLLDSASRPRR